MVTGAGGVKSWQMTGWSGRPRPPDLQVRWTAAGDRGAADLSCSAKNGRMISEPLSWCEWIERALK